MHAFNHLGGNVGIILEHAIKAVGKIHLPSMINIHIINEDSPTLKVSNTHIGLTKLLLEEYDGPAKV